MIHSMTAYARCSKEAKWGQLTWEIRAVNHRYLDSNFKLPEIFRVLEASLRLELQQKLQRGKIECSLKFQPSEKTGMDFSLNTSLVKKIASMVSELNTEVANLGAVDPLKLLGWQDVLCVKEQDTEGVNIEVQELFSAALADLIAARVREGEALQKVLTRDLAAIAEILAKVQVEMPALLAKQRAKFLECFTEAKLALNPERLEQEMLIIAQKTDITEELDRLLAHVKEVKRVINLTEPVGKRLDFLMQELNREANTLAAKSIDTVITKFAVDLKVLIEEMREQVQNVV